jgi:hypothetical protein
VLGASALAAVWAADSPPGTVLLNEDFEAQTPGTHPANWNVYTDPGNDAVVVESPALGQRALRFTDTGGTAWMPAICGFISGEAHSFLRLDCDWRLNATVDRQERAFTLVLRGTGNVAFVTIALGGPGGVAVLQPGQSWALLGVPLQLDQWNHLTLFVDPLAWGAKGACTLVIVQGQERLVFPNIPFTLPEGVQDFPPEYWFSPLFQLGGSDAAGPGVEAYLDNVRVEVVADRPVNP